MMRVCLYCHTEPAAVAFVTVDDRPVCAPCWAARPGVDTTGAHYASHKAVERYLLSTDGPWWVFPPPEPGQAQLRAVACVTPPPAGFCVHCGRVVPHGQGAADVLVAGTPLRWLANHCWRCWELDPDCPTTCTILEEPPCPPSSSSHRRPAFAATAG